VRDVIFTLLCLSQVVKGFRFKRREGRLCLSMWMFALRESSLGTLHFPALPEGHLILGRRAGTEKSAAGTLSGASSKDKNIIEYPISERQALQPVRHRYPEWST
jgi:hypothetical protein